MSPANVLLVIPAHNEAASIERVVAEARRACPDYDILVIDDGSRDDTGQKAREAGAMVLTLSYNLGIGGAVRAGYKFGRWHRYSIVARIDADGQHDPRLLEEMVDLVKSGQADMVIGSRHVNGRGYVPSVVHWIGIRFFAALVSLATRQRFTDTTSGFSVINQRCCSFFATCLPADYPEIEGLIKACKAGYSIKEVPVIMRPRLDGESSIGMWDAVYYVFKVTLTILISASRQREAQKCRR